MRWRKWSLLRKSSSPWASPLHMVPQPMVTGALNDATVPERYPTTHTQDFSAHLKNKRTKKNDLVQGYHQIPVAPEDIPTTVTAVTTPFGLWEFFRMPFGLIKAAQTFPRLMDSVQHLCISTICSSLVLRKKNT